MVDFDELDETQWLTDEHLTSLPAPRHVQLPNLYGPTSLMREAYAVRAKAFDKFGEDIQVLIDYERCATWWCLNEQKFRLGKLTGAVGKLVKYRSANPMIKKELTRLGPLFAVKFPGKCTWCSDELLPGMSAGYVEDSIRCAGCHGAAKGENNV